MNLNADSIESSHSMELYTIPWNRVDLDSIESSRFHEIRGFHRKGHSMNSRSHIHKDGGVMDLKSWECGIPKQGRDSLGGRAV
jgi:hypothetical protein